MRSSEATSTQPSGMVPKAASIRGKLRPRRSTADAAAGSPESRPTTHIQYTRGAAPEPPTGVIPEMGRTAEHVTLHAFRAGDLVDQTIWNARVRKAAPDRLPFSGRYRRRAR